MRQDTLLQRALNVSVESESVDEVIEHLADEQAANGGPATAQTVEQIDEIETDIETLNGVEATVNDENVSLEQLAHARGIVDAIGMRYGAHGTYASMESADGDRLEKEAILGDIQQYREGLDNAVTTSMEGFFLGANNLNGIGENIKSMQDTIALLKSNKEEQLREVSLGKLKLFLKVGGGLPADIPRAIKEVARGLELTADHSDRILTAAQRAAEISIKTDWSDESAADKARDQISALKLDLDKVSSDLNGFPMFGNRTFGVKIKGSSGELGEWNKSYSFGAGTPNAGLLRTTLAAIGAFNLGFGNLIVAAPLLVIAYNFTGENKRELPVKDFAMGLESYAKTAEKIYNQRGNAIRKNTVHTKLMSDLKNVKGLPRDVRKAIARASSFGWSLSNGVYDVVAHSVYALAEAGERARRR